MTPETFSGPDGAALPGFQLDALPLLSRSTVDRREELRTSPAAVASLWSGGQLIVVDAHNRTPVSGDDELAHTPAADFAALPPENAVLLGAHDDVGYWAIRADQDNSERGWLDLRGAGMVLSDTHAGLLTTAVGLLGWHAKAGFCAVCGSQTKPVQSGWMRRCTGCGREEYPRTDPAVICLVHDGADQVLLARSPNWPSERYSVLAGFVEVGESLEASVQREIMEEVGVRVREVRYLGSQPWPFPRSLMLGFAAIGDPADPLCLADGEIEHARWVSRADVRAALEEGSIPGLRVAPNISIAYRMLRGWAYSYS